MKPQKLLWGAAVNFSPLQAMMLNTIESENTRIPPPQYALVRQGIVLVVV
jgi:hypothetical protein